MNHMHDFHELTHISSGRYSPLVGFRTLFYKEILRFWKVSAQTIMAPVFTSLLYLLIFGHTFGNHVEVFPGVSYGAFLLPGLVMMSILQNAFANTSSSLTQSKIMGSLVFVLLPPLSHWEFFAAYVLAAAVRGMVVGSAVLLITFWYIGLSFIAPLWIAVFSLLGATLLGTIGLVVGILAEKFDQLSLFQNFLIMPATFLAGVFYSIHSLPNFWQLLSRINPFFYIIDGFRYGFFGQSDVNPWISFALMSGVLIALAILAVEMLHRGYKLRD